MTICLPPSVDSGRVGDRLRDQGYLLSYNSEYLRERNWIQICLMGECRQEDLEAMLKRLESLTGTLLPGGQRHRAAPTRAGSSYAAGP